MVTTVKKNKTKKSSSKRDQMLMAAKAAAFEKRDDGSDYKEIIDEKNSEISHLKDKIHHLETLKQGKKGAELVFVNPEDCMNWQYADRQDFELGDLEELSEDIQKNGQVQPCILRLLPKSYKGNYKYEVIAGERRWRACSLSKIKLLAEVRDLNDAEAIVVQKSENRKKSICPHSESRQYHIALKNGVMSQNELASQLGYSPSSFSNLLSFMYVDDRVWDAVSDTSRVSPRTAKLVKQYCDKGEDAIQALISLAAKIRAGMGARSLETALIKKLSKLEAEPNKKTVYIDDKKAFVISKSGEIKLSKDVLKCISLGEIEEILSAHISDRIN